MLKLKKKIIVLINTISILGVSHLAYASGENNGISFFSYLKDLIFFLVIFAGVIFLALYLTRFIARNANNFGRGKNITVIEAANLDRNVKIITVKIYEKIYILSISNNHTTVIDKFDQEDLDMDFEYYLNQSLEDKEIDFKEYFESFKNKFKKK